MKDQVPYAFAGHWESWHGKEGEEHLSCAIITTEAIGLMAPIHDRIPETLDRDDYDSWLMLESRGAKGPL